MVDNPTTATRIHFIKFTFEWEYEYTTVHNTARMVNRVVIHVFPFYFILMTYQTVGKLLPMELV